MLECGDKPRDFARAGGQFGFAHQDQTCVGSARCQDVQFHVRSGDAFAPPAGARLPLLAQVRAAPHAFPDHLLPAMSQVGRPARFNLSAHSFHLSSREPRAIGLDETIVEGEERIRQAVEAALGITSGHAKGRLAANETKILQAGQGPRQRRSGQSQSARNLRQAVHALADHCKNRGHPCHVRHVIEQEALWLALQDTQGIEQQVLDSLPEPAMANRQLPVAWHAPPNRKVLHHFPRRPQMQGLLEPMGMKGLNLQDLFGAAIERRLGVEHQAVHHSLRRTTENQPALPSARPVHHLLQQTWELGGRLDQSREFVERQNSPLGSIPPEPIEQLLPPGISHLGETWQEAGDLAGQRRALHGTVSVVPHVVHRRPIGERLLHEARLPQATPSVHGHQRSPPAGE